MHAFTFSSITTASRQRCDRNRHAFAATLRCFARVLRLENVAENANKSTFTGLAKHLSQLPAEKKRAALELSAALAGVSLRVSREFVEAVPDASKVLSADELRAWAELGRRVAMGSAEAGAKFFQIGVDELAGLSADARDSLFKICTRQLVLSSSTALETFRFVPTLARETEDRKMLEDVLGLCVEIANRSAKHSSEFLLRTPAVISALKPFGDDVWKTFVNLGEQFANRTGGMTADLWANVPRAVDGISPKQASELGSAALNIIQHGGSVSLRFLSSGAEVLRSADAVFDDWCHVFERIAAHGNAVAIAFLRATPKFFKQIGAMKLEGEAEGSMKTAAVRRVLNLVGEIARSDAESALAAFRSSASALRQVSIDQYEEWIASGLKKTSDDSQKARRSYFALETRQSNDLLRRTRSGLSLEKVQHVLRLYIEALTGRELEIAPLTAMPQGSRIGDGRTIYLPVSISEFDTDEMDFRLYKVLAAYGAGQVEFGTFQKDTPELIAAFKDLSAFYSATVEQRDAFSLDGYLEAAPVALLKDLPPDSDYRAVLKAFPEPRLARKIFGTMENARIDSRLRHAYRGLRKDLDLMREYLLKTRPYIFDLPVHQVPFELLFQITLCGGATNDARAFYGQIVSEIETVVESYLTMERATVADSLMATSRVYNLFQNISPEQTEKAESNEQEDEREHQYEDMRAEEAPSVEQQQSEKRPESIQDIRDLFNAWNSMDDEGEPDDISGAEVWSQNEMPEQPLEAGDEAFAYDEWDRELNDYRVGWSRVIEKRVKHGDRGFVELARSRYRGVISSIRHQFQLMKPENLTKINRELDGEDYDLNALVDFVIDRRADGRQSENIYTKRLRKQRDVAVSILLDQSSSTARTITRNPLQPYTYPGRRIIEIEKEGLVLMSEALEAVGDVYSINGFTSEGRRNVKFYVVKDFDERYSEETEKRIGGITFQNNTRLGAAIRHASNKLLRQENRTKLLIILTDGRPYDHDYGDARYAREDVREALTEAKISGITPFCITIDRESEAELRDLYGDVGYTIIDDVLSLPERMPNIYRRLTS